MNIDFLAIISVAFLSSFGHCYSMCGGFSLAFIQLHSQDKRLFFLSCTYHFFRIFAYIFLGIIFSTLGGFLFVTPKIQSFIFFLVGIFMIILGISLIFRGVVLNFLENFVVFGRIYKFFIKKSRFYKGYKSAILLGFANGFIPCGLVYFFLANAVISQDIIKGGVTMLIFGLSTLPAMLFFVKVSQILNDNLRKIFNYFSFGIIIIYGLNLAYMGLKDFS